MEQFKTITGFERYQVGEFGTIKSRCFHKERLMRLQLDGDGYLRVRLFRNNRGKTLKVHRLVALHWVENPNPEIYDEVNHDDGDKLNNAKSNLKWTDRAGNNKHAFDTGLRLGMSGIDNPNCKLTLEQIKIIKQLKKEKTQIEIASMFGVSRNMVNLIQNNHYWKC